MATSKRELPAGYRGQHVIDGNLRSFEIETLGDLRRFLDYWFKEEADNERSIIAEGGIGGIRFEVQGDKLRVLQSARLAGIAEALEEWKNMKTAAFLAR